MRRRAILTLICLLTLVFPAAGAAADDASRAIKAEAPWHLERVFVPADRPQDWPRPKGERYLPLDAQEFERRLERLQQATPRPPSLPAARLIQADYTAKLEAGVLVGEGTWRFDRTNASGDAVLIPGWQLTLGNPQWVKSRRRAIVGVDQQNRLAAVVPEPGELIFSWSCAGQRTDDGTTFALSFAACPVSTLTVTLPADTAPFVDGGIVSQQEQLPGGDRRWQVALGGNHAVSLRLVPQNAQQQLQARTLVRHDLAYDLSLRGIELQAQIELRLTGEPLREIAVLADEPLALLAAELDGIAQRLVHASSPVQGQARSIVQLSEPLSGSGHVLRLKAVAATQEGATWRLPLIRLESSHWQQARATLRVRRPLALADLTVSDARQVAHDRTSDAAQDETIELQLMRPDADVHVSVERRPPQVKSTTGASVLLRSNESVGRFTAEFAAVEGEVFSLEADLAPQWIIDTVHSEPAPMLADWSQESRAGSARRLKLLLNSPLTAERKLSVTVSARRRRAPREETFRLDDLQILNFADVQAARRLIHVQAEAQQLQFAADRELARLDPASLSEADAQLLSADPTGIVFLDDGHADSLEVSVAAQPPRCEADIRVEPVVRDDGMTESYRFGILPTGPEMQRVTVQFSQSREEPLDWTIEGSDSVTLTAQRVSRIDSTSGQAAEGETWTVSLPHPRGDPFVLQATRDVGLLSETPVALASVAEAETQRGIVSVSSAGRRRPEVRSRRLKLIPRQQSPPDQYDLTVASFQYDPEQDTLQASEPPLLIDPYGASAALSSAWIWHAQLNSRYDRNSSDHTLTCFVENTGRRSIKLMIPRDNELRGAWVNGQSVADLTSSDSRTHEFDLPPQARFVSIAIQWGNQQGVSWLATTQTAPWPTCDVPILNGDWTVLVAPGCEVTQAVIGNRNQFRATWAQRLFGPLARSACAGLPGLLSTDAWTSAIGPSAGHRRAQDLAARFASDLLDLHANQRSEEPRSWGDSLLQSWHDAVETLKANDIVCLVDDQALAERAIAGRTPWSIGSDAADGAQGLQDLVFLVHPRAVVITTARGAARQPSGHSEAIAPIAADIRPVLPGPWFDRISAAAAEADAALPRLDHWAWLAARPHPAWRDYQAPAAVAPSGWSAIQFDCGPGANAQIVMVDARLMIALAWIIFCVSLGLRWWAGARPPAIELAVLTGAAAIALLVPVSWIPLTAAACLGLVVGIVLTRLPEMQPKEVSAAQRATAGTPGSWAGAAVTGCLVACFAIQRFAAADEADGVHASVPARRVLIPVDAQQRPMGGRYFLSQSFYDHLQRLSDSRGDEPSQYLITGAHYQASVGLEASPGDLSTDAWEAVFDVELLTETATVSLPLGAKGATLIPDGASLDRKPAAFHWDTTKQNIQFELARKGAHRLAIRFRPHIRGNELDFSIPATPSTELKLSNEVKTPLLVDVAGHASRALDGTTPLGPIDHIRLRPTDAGPAASGDKPATYGVDELYWLRVSPGALAVDARLRINVEHGSLHELRLLADRGLQPLMGELHKDDSPVRSVRRQGDLLVVEFSRPITGQATVDLPLWIEGKMGLGTVDLPNCRIAGARAARQFWGVSIDPGLESTTASAQGKAVSVDRFAALWRADQRKPDLALERSDRDAPLRLSARPRQPLLNAQYELGLSIGRRAVELCMAARVDVTGTSAFQYRLSVPEALRIESVLLREQTGEQPLRWSRRGAAELVIFCPSSLPGERTLLVRGRLPFHADQPFVLPDISVANSQCLGYRALVMRRGDVQVDLIDRAGMRLISGQDAGSAVAHWRRSGLLAYDPSTRLRLVAALEHPLFQPASLAITKNDPAVNVLQATRFERRGDGWMAAVDIDLTVDGGTLDELALEVPPHWSGPFEIEPPLEHSIEDIPGETQRRLVLRPEMPFRGAASIAISGPIVATVGQRPGPPDVLVPGVGQVSRYFLLPRQWDNQQLSWDTRGLVQKPLPQPLADRVETSAYRTYQLVGDRFRAVLRSVERTTENPLVRLADVSLSVCRDGRLYGVAAFDIEPAGANDCILQLPEACLPVHMQVDGAPVQYASQGRGQFSIWLGRSKLARRLEAVFMAQDAQRLTEFAPPQLVGLPVQRTLLTVSSSMPPETILPQPTTVISPVQQELHRFGTIVDLVEYSATALVEERSEDVTRWFRPWRRRLAASLAHFERARAIAPGGDAVAEFDRLAELQQEESRLSTRLGVPKALNVTQADQKNLATGPAELWRATQPARHQWVFAVAEPQLQSLAVLRPQPDVWEFGLRVAVAIGLICLSLALWLSSRRRWVVAGWNPALTYGAIVLTGAVWCWWLQPIAVGLLIMLTGAYLLWLALHGGRPDMPTDATRRGSEPSAAGATGIGGP